MNKITTGLTIALILNQSACSWLGLRDRSSDYLLAEETQPTVVPAEIDSARLGQIYPIPPIAADVAEVTTDEVPRPQPASVNTFEQLVKIQSINEHRWVLINIPPSEVWPRLRNALNRNGVPSAKAQGSTGIIETVWVAFNSDQQNSHRFRFMIAPGVQVDSSEISVLHQQVVKGSEEGVIWPEHSDSDKREQDILTMLANDLASESDYASVSLLAQHIGGEPKVEIVSPAVSDPYILIKLDFDRVWASVSYSAVRGGFLTVDKDRSQGVFFVNYSPQQEDDQGFFSRWFGGGSDDEIIETNYRILVQSLVGSVEVRIVGAQGESLKKTESLALLKILRGNMS